MRKIYQAAPDVPQAIANKAVDIIERHLNANGVRRAEELPEESKIHLMRELQRFFHADLSQGLGSGDSLVSVRTSNPQSIWQGIRRWLRGLVNRRGPEISDEQR